jgi:hypothetical protein
MTLERIEEDARLPIRKMLLSVWGLFLLASLPAWTADHALVVVDTSEKAYTVFMAISAKDLDRVRSQTAGKQGVAIIARSKLEQEKQGYITSRILRDEYPGSGAADGILALLAKYPGTPFGLTWNGGLALTYNDYQHAKKLYEAYLKDPAEYKRTGTPHPRVDPINPKGHLGPLLGW